MATSISETLVCWGILALVALALLLLKIEEVICDAWDSLTEGSR